MSPSSLDHPSRARHGRARGAPPRAGAGRHAENTTPQPARNQQRVGAGHTSSVTPWRASASSTAGLSTDATPGPMPRTRARLHPVTLSRDCHPGVVEHRVTGISWKNAVVDELADELVFDDVGQRSASGRSRGARAQSWRARRTALQTPAPRPKQRGAGFVSVQSSDSSGLAKRAPSCECLFASREAGATTAKHEREY